jgi:tetratricopeptide (TPR) repeat protein
MDADDRVSSLVADADALVAVKRYAEAAARAQAAIGLAPEDARPYCELSRALHGEGRYAEAAQMADEAIRLAPEQPRGFLLRSMALRSVAGQRTGSDRAAVGLEAVSSAREIVRLAPWDPSGFIALAQALPLTGAIEEADGAIQEAIRLAPDSASTWAAASRVALAAKNWNAAIVASRRSLAIDPNNYAALNNLGVALRSSGKGREGTEVLARAAQVQPDSPTARRNLSRAGLNVIRVAILILLIPIGFLAHVGLGLYLLFVIGSNLVLLKNPSLVLRLERWTAPIALFFARRTRRETSRHGRRAAEERPFSFEADAEGRPWSAVKERAGQSRRVAFRRGRLSQSQSR